MEMVLFDWVQLVLACTGVVAWGAALLIGALLLHDKWAAKRRRRQADELWKKRVEAKREADAMRQRAMEIEARRRQN